MTIKTLLQKAFYLFLTKLHNNFLYNKYPVPSSIQIKSGRNRLSDGGNNGLCLLNSNSFSSF